MRETIDISRIKQQEDICAEIFETVTADGKRPLAMVDTYGCQQNEADSEKLCASTPRCAFSATSAR